MNSRLKRLKKSVELFFNAYWLKEYYMLLKYHRLSSSGAKREPMLVSIVDSKRQGKRLTDRTKGIISVHALAKPENKRSRCTFNHPCQLTHIRVHNTSNCIPPPRR